MSLLLEEKVDRVSETDVVWVLIKTNLYANNDYRGKLTLWIF